MNFPKKALLGSLLLMSASSAFAIDTADLSVIGTIAPTACTPTFAGGGVVDYGLIPTASLSPTVATVLAVRPISYTIHCDAPIAIATTFMDNRAGSASVVSNANFGLGLQGTNKIGSYTVFQVSADAMGDGAPVDLLFRIGESPWTPAAATNAQTNDGNRFQSYAPVGTIVPGTYSDFSGTLQVTATIAPTSTLDLSIAVTLDGLSTMTVRYL